MRESPSQPSRAQVGALPRGFGRAIVWLRWPVLALWAAAAALAATHLPTFGSSQGPIVELVPANAPALKTTATSLRLFKVPAGSDFAVVLRDPRGLSARATRAVAAQALAVDRRSGQGGQQPSAAVPIANTLRLAPAARESSTTAVTYLSYPASMPVGDEMASATAYARSLSAAAGVPAGLTGATPGQVAQGNLIEKYLDLVELVTLLVVVAIIGLRYRSPVAPIVPLAAIAVTLPLVLVALHQLTARFGLYVPQELQPVVVALLLGIVTDYSIFFLSGVRRRRRAGDDRLAAVRSSTAEFSPIMLVSGIILACGMLALLVASLGFFQDLGPALAITVAIALVVSLTLLPALLAVAGRLAYWPGSLQLDPAAEADEQDAQPGRVARAMTARPVAAVTALACIAALTVAAVQLTHLQLGFGQVSDLPSDSTPQRAAANARAGFAAGILAPTTVLVQSSNAGPLPRPGLSRLEGEIGRLPEVAGVLGPREQPTAGPASAFVTPRGNAARVVVVFRDDPLSAYGIRDLQHLQTSMPDLAATAGLGSAQIGYAGETALADDTITAIHADLVKVTAVVLAINLLLLVLFLRGLTAPVFLLLSSVGAVAASLGITTWVFQTYLGYHQLDYYVPFVVAVLLISLGSDYNVFVVGRIWQEARLRPLRDAVAVAAPRAASTIRTAGITLAASFAAIALIPVRSFREIAFAMVVGLLIETFLVRSLLVPALITLFGQASGWPGRRLQRGDAVRSQAELTS